MKLFRLENMTSGWFVGDFEPTSFRTSDFEACYRVHPAGEHWPSHYHKIATEVNLLISGRMRLGGALLTRGDIFILEPGDIADPVFEEDCAVICLKRPSAKEDKYLVHKQP